MNCPNCGSKMVKRYPVPEYIIYYRRYMDTWICACGETEDKPTLVQEYEDYDWRKRWKEANSEVKDEKL